MESGACQTAHPIVWMIISCIAEHLGASDHTLSELFRKRGQ